MLPHNGDRLGAVHGASHRSETKLWQEHKHRLYEERVVVNDDDTSVPLKRHSILQSLSGRDASVRYVLNVRPQLAKGALAEIICGRSVAMRLGRIQSLSAR